MVGNGTERDLTEEVTQEKVPYETLLEILSDVGEGLLVMEDGRIRYANEAFCKISGYTMAALAAFPSFLEVFAHDQRRLVEHRMCQYLSGEAGENRYETTILHSSGRRVDLEVAVRLQMRNNRAPQLIALVRDITDHKRLDEKLESSLAGLVAIHEASRILGTTLEMEEIGAKLLEIVRRMCPISAAIINLRNELERTSMLCAFGPESLCQRARNTPKARAARHGALETKEHQLFQLNQRKRGDDLSAVGLCLPLVVRDQVTGVLEVYGPKALAEKATVGALQSLTGQAATALENARLHRELTERELRLQELLSKLLVAQEEERRRVAYDIHDGLTQVAAAAHHHLQAYVDEHPPDSLLSQKKLDQILNLAEQTVDEARRVIADLRPTALETFGLTTGLRMLVDSLRADGWEIEYEEALGDESLPSEIETALYRLLQEACTNLRKHARTDRAWITLRRLSDSVYLEVENLGHGADCTTLSEASKGSAPGERVGLQSMQERIALLGGEFRIHNRPWASTYMVAEIPLLDPTPVRAESFPNLLNGTSSARLLIADDHALVREGLRALLTREPDLDVVGEATNGRDAVELCRHLHPDLALMDVRMPTMDGLAATRAIKAEGSAAGVLMLSVYENPDYLFEAIQAGACGYVIKNACKRELIGAVRKALAGQNPLNQDLAMRLLRRLSSESGRRKESSPESGKQSMPFSESLTPRELEVLRLLALGHTNRQISHKLVVSPATVKVHVEHVLAKLDVSDRTQAAVRASEAGLLVP